VKIAGRMKIAPALAHAAISGGLGGLLLGFDGAVVSGATSGLTRAYHLSPAGLGFTVSIALWGAVAGALLAGIPGDPIGRRDTLRILAVLYLAGALGCLLAALPAALFLALLAAIPRGPRWLVEKGRLAEARAVLAAIGETNTEAALDSMRAAREPARVQPAAGARRRTIPGRQILFSSRAVILECGASAVPPMFRKDSHHIYRVPELEALPWLAHGFGTRLSAIPADLTTVKQIHSADCVFAEGRRGNLGQGDALLDNTPGSALAVKTADCVPILLADERLRAVAAVHAGWRGAVAGIARRAVESLVERFGTNPADLHAALGPAIGQCCYEVGPEVAAHFGRAGRAHIDLLEANRAQLRSVGIPANRIYPACLCTMCRADEFHSYRRDKEAAGRMYSFIGVLA